MKSVPYAYRLIRARENIGYLQNEAADLLGASGQFLASFESGKKKASYADLMNLAQLYHVDFDFLTADIPEDMNEIWPETAKFKNGILRKARVRTGNKIEEAAKELMIDEHQLFLLEYGAAYPVDELLESMALFYGVSVDDLNKVKDYALISYYPQTLKKPHGSAAEKRIEKYLNECGIQYEREFNIPSDNCPGMLRADFIIFNDKYPGYKILALEFDGKQHFFVTDYVVHLMERHFHDLEKTKWLEETKIPLLRIRYDEEDSIEELIDDFLAHSEDFLTAHSRNWENYYDFRDLRDGFSVL